MRASTQGSTTSRIFGNLPARARIGQYFERLAGCLIRETVEVKDFAGAISLQRRAMADVFELQQFAMAPLRPLPGVSLVYSSSQVSLLHML